MDVLNSRTIRLSFPKEVQNSLRKPVQSAIESVCYMFVVQASLASYAVLEEFLEV